MPSGGDHGASRLPSPSAVGRCRQPRQLYCRSEWHRGTLFDRQPQLPTPRCSLYPQNRPRALQARARTHAWYCTHSSSSSAPAAAAAQKVMFCQGAGHDERRVKTAGSPFDTIAFEHIAGGDDVCRTRLVLDQSTFAKKVSRGVCLQLFHLPINELRCSSSPLLFCGRLELSTSRGNKQQEERNSSIEIAPHARRTSHCRPHLPR